MGKYYWIKERHNPQFKEPYYCCYSNKITVKQAQKMEDSLYGYNNMLKFNSEEDYNAKIKELELSDKRISFGA